MCFLPKEHVLLNLVLTKGFSVFAPFIYMTQEVKSGE